MNSLHYTSTWRLDAPLAAVWAALTRVEDWPRWWPYVESVETIRQAEGVGAVRRLHWRTLLPYRLSLVMTCTAAERERRLAGASRGHLLGEGEWTLSQDGDQTLARYDWRVALVKPWMRRFAWLLQPLFAWNHGAVMRAGEAGLQRWLSRR